MKLNKFTIGGAIFAVLVLLIFFSKTIYNSNLPSVTASKPSNGRLSKLEMSSGIVEWSRTENIYAPLSGYVAEILVSEGDRVEAGQAMLLIRYDREETERKLKELESSRAKIAMDIQSLNMRLAKTNKDISELKNEVYEKDEYELNTLLLDIEKAERDLENSRVLFEIGEISADDVKKAEDSLNSLYRKKENTKKTLDTQVSDKEKSRTTKLSDYEADIASTKLDLQAKALELSNLDLQEETYREALRDFDENTTLTAPSGGIVTFLDADKGGRLNENQKIASIGLDDGFVLECQVSLSNNFIITGDTCEVSNSTHVLKGEVIKIEPSSQSKTVKLSLVSDELTAGETFDVKFEKVSTTTYTLVPNGAVNQDSSGYYLNQVKRRDGLLGKEYYLERQDVYIGDSDSSNTIIIRGVTFFEPVILSSDMPVDPGDTVLLENAGDFFEN